MRASTIAVVLAAALLAPSAAAAKTAPTPVKGQECTRAADVQEGAVARLTTGTVGDDGKLVFDDRVAHLKGGKVYIVVKDATIAYHGVTYTAQADTIFLLTCFGESARAGAIFPSIDLLTGVLSAHAREGKPGAIVANEAMWGPAGRQDISFRVSRTAKGDPSPVEIFSGGPETLSFGTSKVAKTAGDGYLNVTPYVGPRPGSCRHAKGGTFVSKRLKRGYYQGTADYDGLAPGYR